MNEDANTKRDTLSREPIPYSEAIANLQGFLTCEEFPEMSMKQVAKISLEVNFRGEFSMILDTSIVDICIEV